MDYKNEAAEKLKSSNVGNYIDTYMKKIAHAIETGAKLEGFDDTTNCVVDQPAGITLFLPCESLNLDYIMR